jgi:hypothetical protein
MKRVLILFSAAVISAAALLAFASEWIPLDTTISVRTNENIRIGSNDGEGRVYSGVINNDVFDRDGNLLVPRGSSAELIVRRTGHDEVAIDLDSISVNGRRYAVAATESQQEGVRSGSGKRTGEFAGGGAILGTILGAVAGGGKGAAIGAVSGAGAGLGAGLLTRGKNLNVPAESLLTFRLVQPIKIDMPDTGYDRDGHHYHGNPGH